MSDLKDAMEGLGPVASGLGASGTAGRILREARETRRLSLDDVAQHLKYAPRQIEALERDDYAQLPAATVVRGMVRSYAKFLELAPEPLLDEVNKHLAPSSAPVVSKDTRGMAVPFPVRPGGAHRGWWIVSALVALGVVAVLVDWSTLRDTVVKSVGPLVPSLASSDAPAAPAKAAAAPGASSSGGTPVAIAPTSADETRADASAPSNVPAPTVAAAPSSTAQAPAASVATPAVAAATPATTPASTDAATGTTKRVEFRFAKDSWVEARTADNRILMNQLNPGGTAKTLEVQGEVRLAIGAADGVTLSFDGKPVDLVPLTQMGVARVTLK